MILDFKDYKVSRDNRIITKNGMSYIPIEQWTENEFKEWIKCRNDVMYFIKNYVYVMVEKENKRFKLYDVMYEPQKELIKNLLEKRQVIVLKSRQTGITTILSQIIQWLSLFNTQYKIGILSYKGSHQSNFISKKLKTVFNYLPKCFMKPIETNNKKEMVFNDLNGEVTWVQQEQPGPESEPFTGETMNFIFVDEQAKVRNIETHLSSILPQMSTTLSQSEEQQKKRPSQIAIVSTPKGTQGIGKWFYDTYKKAEQNFNQLSESQREGNFGEINVSKVKEQNDQEKELSGMSYFPQFIHWRKCGLGEEWYEKQKKILEYDTKKIKQELEQEFLGSGDSYYNLTFLNKIEYIEPKNKTLYWERKDINGEIHKGQKTIRLWEYPKKNRQYIIGIDPQTKDGEDNTGFEVIDGLTAVQVQEWFGSRLNTVDMQYFAYTLQEYFNDQLLQIESNQGYHLTEKLLEELLYSNIYFDKKDKQGIWVGGQNRSIIIDEISVLLPEYDMENYNFIRSKDLKEELFSFENRGNKRQEQKSGRHDDLIFQFQYQLYVRNKQMGDILKTTRMNEQEIKTKLMEKEASKILSNDVLLDQMYSNDKNSNKTKLFQQMIKNQSGEEFKTGNKKDDDTEEDEKTNIDQLDVQDYL